MNGQRHIGGPERRNEEQRKIESSLLELLSHGTLEENMQGGYNNQAAEKK